MVIDVRTDVHINNSQNIHQNFNAIFIVLKNAVDPAQADICSLIRLEMTASQRQQSLSADDWTKSYWDIHIWSAITSKRIKLETWGWTHLKDNFLKFFFLIKFFIFCLKLWKCHNFEWKKAFFSLCYSIIRPYLLLLPILLYAFV